MASLVLLPRRKKAQLKDQDWEPWKDFVYVEYLVKNRELEEVVHELRRGGLDVTCVSIFTPYLLALINVSATAKAASKESSGVGVSENTSRLTSGAMWDMLYRSGQLF